MAQIGNFHNPEGRNKPEYSAQNDTLWYQKAPNEDCKAEEWEVWNRESTRIRKNL